MKKVLIIGCGAAGMMAAISAAQEGHEVIVFEKNEKPGKKIYITGKGRCNITNACDIEDLFGNIITNNRFMYSSIYSFTNDDVIDFFNNNGCQTKIERGNRVFPVSDKSSDVIQALSRKMKELGVKINYNTEVDEILTKNIDENSSICNGLDCNIDKNTSTKDELITNIEKGSENNIKENKNAGNKYSSKKNKLTCTKIFTGVKINDERLQTKIVKGDALIIATGGLSYASTGSTGDGYNFAKKVGHSVTDLSPSLVPINLKGNEYKQLQGLSLKNVNLTITMDNKSIYSDMGEMLFTHFGISGPLVLTSSCYILKALSKKKANDKNIKIYIDLKPALSHEQLDQRLVRDFNEFINKDFKNSLDNLLPKKLISVIIERSGIDKFKKVNAITKEERTNLVNVIKSLEFEYNGLRDYNEAIITKGGIKVNEINPSTMMSKLVKNLYFAGEVIDVDAFTGGFNLQIAWSTGYLAGKLME